jgi:hypothetical protein
MLKHEIEYQLSKTEAVLNKNLPVLVNVSAPDRKQIEIRCNVICNILGAMSARKWQRRIQVECFGFYFNLFIYSYNFVPLLTGIYLSRNIFRK